jgi:4-hydroxy-3-methylbut-2-enyl diphosphate reductase
MHKTIRLNENGFCYGVNNAIKISLQTIKDDSLPKPIYLLGNLVHNNFVKKYLISIGIHILDGNSRLEMIKKIHQGTIIFSAHGVSDRVVEVCKEKGLTIVDATCPYVRKTFMQMKQAIYDGYSIIFVGKENHPETEAALEISENVFLFDPLKGQLSHPITANKIALCHQTTMSSYDIQTVVDTLLYEYPNIERLNMLCNVTEKRQQAIMDLHNKLKKRENLLIVIGDKTSNNSTKLYEMAKRINEKNVIFVNDISDISLDDIRGFQTFYLISGTSTPLSIVCEIEKVLNNLDNIHTNRYYSKLTLKDYMK